MLAKVDWLWLAIGIIFALFILPMIQAWISARKNGGTNGTSTA